VRSSICYHTRLASNDQKITGGTFGGHIDQDTVERLTKAWFTVEVKAGGTPVFVDRQGRQVRAYIYIDPGETEIGEKAVAAWRAERRLQQEELEKRETAEQAELEDLMSGMTHEEIVRRLKGADE
jgi:hypothetical protein